jgi:crotonobetainyl-CoA:carnitine CoA-transferase CaiB-like acyl-CoA transferase
MKGPLAGITVIDFTRVLAGPLASMTLADMGADVIKIEEPEGGDLYRTSGSIHINGEAVNFLSTNRNKKSVTLDVTKPEGYRILEQLVASADVFLENFRPGVTDKLRIDYERLRVLNPRLIYGSITGFGSSGPFRNRAAVDPVIQAESGIMSLTGDQGGSPVRIGTAVGDIYGAMLAAQGIGFALYAREKTGLGQKVELSLLDASLFGLIPREGEYLATGTVFPRMGSGHPQFVPFQNFATSDGFVFVAAFHDALYRKLCTALGRADLATHADYLDNTGRSRNRVALLAELEPIFATRTSAQWVALLEPSGMPIGRVNDLADVFEHPQVKHNGMVVEMDHPVAGKIRLLNNPLRFSEDPVQLHSPPPLLGQHTGEVLARLGYAEGDLEELHRQGVI